MDKVVEIFRELVGDRAKKLDATHYPADIVSTMTEALIDEYDDPTEEQILTIDMISHNLIDWQSDAAFLVALTLFPEKFTKEEIQDEVRSLLIHVPDHIREAEKAFNRADELA